MELCRDVQNIIIRKMDIDTRRHFGIYTRLKCPLPLQSLITAAICKIQFVDDKSYVCLGSIRHEQSKYEICRFFDHNEMVDYRLHYFPENSNMLLVYSLDDDDE